MRNFANGLISLRCSTLCANGPAWLKIEKIADLGAGTGMLADVFLANGNPVTAVEPNQQMQEVCRSLHPDKDLLLLVDAPAEETTLQDSSVDMVAVWRAFHWFDVDRVMSEFQLGCGDFVRSHG